MAGQDRRAGVRLRYDERHAEDRFGGLTQARVTEFYRPPDAELTAEAFEVVWRTGPFRNDAEPVLL